MSTIQFDSKTQSKLDTESIAEAIREATFADVAEETGCDLSYAEVKVTPQFDTDENHVKFTVSIVFPGMAEDVQVQAERLLAQMAFNALVENLKN